jgi:hypothetical protein
MVTKIFAVWDKKVKVYRFPHMLPSNGQALRSFTEAANDLASEIGKYPDDFVLYESGSFDDATGMLTPLNMPMHLGEACNFVIDKEVKNA